MKTPALLLSLGLSTASLALASAASAAPAVLWACHGPAGQALGAAALTAEQAGDGHATSTCNAGGGALSASFSLAAPSGGSTAAWRADLPTVVRLTGVRADRTTSGFGGGAVPGSPQRYSVATSDRLLEGSDLDAAGASAFDGTFDLPATGTSVRFGVTCALPADEHCAAPPSGTAGVRVRSFALAVDDADAPHGAVGGIRSPAAGTLMLLLRATDAGLGLASASVTIDGAAAASADLRGGQCAELSPGDATVDLAVGALCPATVTDVALPVDTTLFRDGVHRLRVLVRDAAGNESAVADEDITVRNQPIATTSTVTIQVGGGGTTGGGAGNPGGPGAPGNPGGPGTPGTPGSTADQCLKPSLSMALAQKPLRTKKGVVVLRYHRGYLFTGRLTCQSGTHRRSAAKGTPVQLYNVIGKSKVLKSGTTVRRKGQISVILRYQTARTIVFSYRSADKRTVTVKIKIKIARR